MAECLVVASPRAAGAVAEAGAAAAKALGPHSRCLQGLARQGV